MADSGWQGKNIVLSCQLSSVTSYSPICLSSIIRLKLDERRFYVSTKLYHITPVTRYDPPATRLDPHHQVILDYIDQHGLITDRDYAQLTPRVKATRALDFKRLIELGLIQRKGSGRSIYYQRT